MPARKTKDLDPPKRESQVISEDRIFDIIPKDNFLMKVNKVIRWRSLVKLVQPLYDDRMGRPVTNYPIMMLKAIFVQTHLGLSDEQTRESIHFNMLYRKFCGYGPREKVFEKTALSNFRLKLIEADLYKPLLYEINRQLKEKGLIRKNGTAFIDSTMVIANISPLTLTQYLQETLRLLIVSLKKKAPQVFSEFTSTYDDRYDYILGPREPTIAFIDPVSRTRNLETLVGDSFELLCFLEDHDLPDEVISKVDFLKETLEQLIEIEDRQPKRDEKVEKMVLEYGKEEDEEKEESSDDRKEAGLTVPSEVGVKIIPNRKIKGKRRPSPHDPDATWGRDSRKKSIPGYRPEVMVNEDRFVIDVVVRTACESEGMGDNLVEMFDDVVTNSGIELETACGDQAYGGQETVEELAKAGIEMIAKPRLTEVDMEGELFRVDRENLTCSCQVGRTTSLKLKESKNQLVGHFLIKGCINCPYWHFCGGEVKVRVRRVVFPAPVSVAHLIEKMHDLDSVAWDLLSKRSYTVEPTIGEFVQAPGMRRTKYRGTKKVEFQWSMRGAWINLRRAVKHLKKKRLELNQSHQAGLERVERVLFKLGQTQMAQWHLN
jgi:hypothetical protein